MGYQLKPITPSAPEGGTLEFNIINLFYFL
jgi:hypothetical protein